MSRVSVVIPLYNDADNIERAVSSALKQGHELAGIWIVDDCSQDGSLVMASELAEREPKVHVARLPVNSGPAAARNHGASLAGSEFLCFLDSDDEFLEGYFRKALEVLDANPQMQALKVGMEFFDPVRGYLLPRYDRRYDPVVFSSPCNVMMRCQSFLRMGGFSVDKIFREAHGGEDVAFCKALAEHLPPLGRIDDVFYRCWSDRRSHLHRFLATTRLAANEDGFEFLALTEAQQPGGSLEKAMAAYMHAVQQRLAATADQ